MVQVVGLGSISQGLHPFHPSSTTTNNKTNKTNNFQYSINQYFKKELSWRRKTQLRHESVPDANHPTQTLTFKHINVCLQRLILRWLVVPMSISPILYYCTVVILFCLQMQTVANCFCFQLRCSRNYFLVCVFVVYSTFDLLNVRFGPRPLLWRHSLWRQTSGTFL